MTSSLLSDVFVMTNSGAANDDRVSIMTMLYSTPLVCTEALKGHRVVWKIEIYHLIRMT